MKPFYIISGPTCTGKTNLAIELAKKIPGAEVYNFDSLLFYKELSIGTARPSLSECQGVPHHLMDMASIALPINAADFVQLAQPLLEAAMAKSQVAILVGGSGFYLRALSYGMYPSSDTTEEIRNEIEEQYKLSGIGSLWEELQRVDPERAEALHVQDHYRIKRALEHFRTTLTPFSVAESAFQKKNQESTLLQKHLQRAWHIYLDMPKPEHYQWIQKRTELMLKQGLITEVEELLKQGFTGLEKPLQSIGYKEAQDFLKGKLKSTAELSEAINIATRQLAKAQRTWFKKVSDKKQYHPIEQHGKALSEALQFLDGRT